MVDPRVSADRIMHCSTINCYLRGHKVRLVMNRGKSGSCQCGVDDGSLAPGQSPGGDLGQSPQKLNTFSYLTVSFACHFAREHSEYAEKSVCWWRRGAVGRVSNLRARGRGFESRPGTRRRNPGQVSHTCVPLFTKQYKLVPAKGR